MVCSVEEALTGDRIVEGSGLKMDFLGGAHRTRRISVEIQGCNLQFRGVRPLKADDPLEWS